MDTARIHVLVTVAPFCPEAHLVADLTDLTLVKARLLASLALCEQVLTEFTFESNPISAPAFSRLF